MKIATLIIIGLGAFFLCAESSSPACAQTVSTETPSEISTVTLYSPNKYKEQSRAVFDFQKGTRPASSWGRWDLGYGFLYAGEDFDWLQSSSAQGHRSLIRDLGKHDWTDNLAVPEVEPLAKLKPGEQRTHFVDASGADGADGKGARPAPIGTTENVWSRALPERHGSEPNHSVPQPQTEAAPAASRPKRDGKTKTSSQYVKAIVGHVYVIHVVDDDNDFYALFRVETLERGDNCTISWRLIPAPDAQASPRK